MNIKIKKDLYRIIPRAYSFGNLIKGMRSKGFKYLLVIRLLNLTNSVFVKFFLRIILRFLTYRYGFQIPYQTKIGGGLFIGHFGTIVISINADIGENCNIAHNVTIGTARGKRDGAPKIGNKVWIGTGAVITGNISVGDNVLIAPNAFVNIDIPSNSIALGNPVKILPKDNPTKYYINNEYKA
jgi:serine O-acetyltransferase